MKIIKLKLKYIDQVADLVKTTFTKFCKNDCTKEGFEWYISQFKKENRLKLIKDFKGIKFFYVAIENDRIIGEVTGRENHIGSLFVSGEYHRKGVGTKLLKKVEKDIWKMECDFIKINASLYAVSFYQKMGYKKTTGIKNFNGMGIKVQPMKKELKLF